MSESGYFICDEKTGRKFYVVDPLNRDERAESESMSPEEILSFIAKNNLRLSDPVENQIDDCSKKVPN